MYIATRGAPLEAREAGFLVQNIKTTILTMEILMTITFCFKIPSKHLYGLSVHITQIWVESVFRFSVAEFSPASLVSRKVVDSKYVLRKRSDKKLI